jgi:hypothetical protein
VAGRPHPQPQWPTILEAKIPIAKRTRRAEDVITGKIDARVACVPHCTFGASQTTIQPYSQCASHAL